LKLNKLTLAVSLGLALAGSAMAETTTVAETIVITEPEVRTLVVDEGFSDPILVERDGDLWRVKSVATGGTDEVTLFVNSEGQVLGAADVARSRMTQTTTTTTETTTTTPAPAEVTSESVNTTVMNAGFTNVHDIDFLEDEGVWKAEADDSRGEDYELHVDASSGEIVHIEDD
jgi:uncharacterized membrane protein YkoI